MRARTQTRFTSLDKLAVKLGCKWSAISQSIDQTEKELTELEKLLLPPEGRPLAENLSLVFFGSRARGESTSRSDVDWTLLVNGEVDGLHLFLAQEIRRKLLEAKFIEPGTTGTFGGLAFSHELVHFIGGQEDSNKNLTLRMLLLLESISVGDDGPRQMVIRAILQRYLGDDPHWTWKPDGKIPRFLLNDVIRFWRTMAVDFADKFHDQEGEKWALRNAKLRFSRKLLLLKGLLACFSWQMRGMHAASTAGDDSTARAVTYYEHYFSLPPLEILADEMMRSGAQEGLCRKVFQSYDSFLVILSDKHSRSELDQIPRRDTDKSEVFQRVRTLSHEFRDGLLDWLYAPDSALCSLMRQYALF